VLNIQLLLIVLHYCGEIWGRTRFQKIIFLLQERFEIKFSYRFIPYHYGPYSKDLQFDIDLLHFAGAIQVELRDGTPYMYSLAQKGIELAQKAEQKIDPGELQRLIAGVDYIKYRSTDSLIEEAKSIANLAIQ